MGMMNLSEPGSAPALIRLDLLLEGLLLTLLVAFTRLPCAWFVLGYGAELLVHDRVGSSELIDAVQAFNWKFHCVVSAVFEAIELLAKKTSLGLA